MKVLQAVAIGAVVSLLPPAGAQGQGPAPTRAGVHTTAADSAWRAPWSLGIQRLSGDDLRRGTPATVEQGMSGKVPGVNITAFSGAPNTFAVIHFPGVASILNATPL